jgi:hypothetical protein
MADNLKPTSSDTRRHKPEEWEVNLTIGDPDYSTVGMIAIFHKKGEPVEWKTLPPKPIRNPRRREGGPR